MSGATGPEGVQVTLRAAAGAAALQQAFAAWRAAQPAADGDCAVLVEGALATLDTGPVALRRLGAGCPCCAGSVLLRVGLTRLLRERRPRAVLLLVAADAHLERIGRWLADGSWGVSIAVDAGAPHAA